MKRVPCGLLHATHGQQGMGDALFELHAAFQVVPPGDVDVEHQIVAWNRKLQGIGDVCGNGKAEACSAAMAWHIALAFAARAEINDTAVDYAINRRARYQARVPGQQLRPALPVLR